MATPEQLATRVRRILTAALPTGIRVEVTARGQEGGSAFDVSIQTGATDHRFLAGWAGEGWPRDVEELVRLVPHVRVAVAINLSDNAKSLLSGQGIGWIDEVGEANIVMPSGLVIVREQSRTAGGAKASSRWSRSTLAVAEAALSGIAPTVNNIEISTGLSRNATASGLARLERLGLLERQEASRGPKSGRRVVDPRALLDSYSAAAAEHRSKQSTLRAHRLWVGDPVTTLRTEIAPALSDSNHRWSVTGAAASVLLAPYLTEVTTLDLYVDADLMADPARLALRIGARIVDRGHVIEVRELPTSISALGPVVDGIQVAPPVRVYADLFAAGGRWAEAAEHLLEGFHAGTAA